MTISQPSAQTDLADFHGGPVDACVRSDRQTTHQGKNSHARLRLRAITRRHAFPGTVPLALRVGVAIHAQRHLVGQSAVVTERKPLVVYMIL